MRKHKVRRETRERADNADNDGSSDAIRVEKKVCVCVWGGVMMRRVRVNEGRVDGRTRRRANAKGERWRR